MYMSDNDKVEYQLQMVYLNQFMNQWSPFHESGEPGDMYQAYLDYLQENNITTSPILITIFFLKTRPYGFC